MEITDIKVSYTILTHNEGASLKMLLDSILKYKTTWDEVVIVDDNSDNKVTNDIIESVKDTIGVKIFKNSLNNDFSAQKNFANSKCNNDYIFNIDADEILPDFFMETYKEILFINPACEAFRLPRINTVDGITLKHIEQWRWQISTLPTMVEERAITYASEFYMLLKAYNLILKDDKGLIKFLTPLINYPDYQTRIYKRLPDIRWERNVHEFLTGYKTFSNFPREKNYSIIHNKPIDKQEKQNNFYQKLI